MPIPRFVARVNKLILNRVMLRLADRPPFAALTHIGRKTGRGYRIPINAVRSADGFLFALTYGPDTDWVRNVLASQSAELEYSGERIALESPIRIERESALARYPMAVRILLRALGVEHFLLMRRA